MYIPKEKFTEFKIVDAKSQWHKFHITIECPICKDASGHSGIFEDDNHPGTMGSDGYCFKCTEYFGIDSPEARAQRVANLIRFHKQEKKVRNINYARLGNTTNKIRTLINSQVENWKEKTTQQLLARGYSPAYIQHLIAAGYMYAEPFKDNMYLLNVDPMAAALRKVYFNGKEVDNFTRYRLANPPIEGLAIPLYHGIHKIGYHIRNADINAENRYMPYAFRAKDLSKKQREDRFMPTYTYKEEKVTKDSITGSDEIYLTEGPLKADAINYYFNRRVIGACGTMAFQSAEVQELLFQNKDRKIIVVPDRDYSTKFSVGYAYAKLFYWLSVNGFEYEVLEWYHPDKAINETLKGVDDAIVVLQIENLVNFTRITKNSAFTKLEPDARRRVVKKNSPGLKSIRPGTIIAEKDLELMAGLIVRDDTDIIAKPDLVYKVEDRQDAMTQALAEHKLVVDISPTGSGKTHGVGLLNVEVCNDIFLEHRVYKQAKYNSTKQINMFDHGKPSALKFKEFQDDVKINSVTSIVYVSQSPMNVDVSTLNKWTLRVGRNHMGWAWDAYLNKIRAAKPSEPLLYEPNCPQAGNIIKLRNQRQVLHIKQEICDNCPIKDQGCKYLGSIDKANKAKYSKVSQNSFSSKQGTLAILDDPASMQFHIVVKVTMENIYHLLDVVNMKSKWKGYKPLLQKLLLYVFEEVKKGLSLEDIYKAMDKSGHLNKYPIHKWLTLPEPDKISQQFRKIYASGELEFTGKYKKFADLHRWLFIFLEVFSGKQAGNMYYDSAVSSWVLKGLDPKHKDGLEASAGHLILDSTANKQYYANIYGQEPFIISSEGDPSANVTISVVEGFRNTYKKGLYFDNAAMVKAKAEYINEYARNHPDEGVGLITYKSLYEGDFKDMWDPSITKGYWFLSERSSNAFYENKVKTLFLMGMPIPNLGAVAAEVDSKGSKAEALVARPYGPVKEDGTRDYIINRDFADKVTRDLLWYKVSSSYVQSLGRLRAIQRPGEQLKLIIMDKIALPFRVDEIIKVGPEEVKDRLSLSTNEYVTKMNYLNGLVKFVKIMEEKFESRFDIEAMHYVNSSINAATLSKLGVTTLKCQNYADIYKVLDKAIANLEANPDLVLNSFLKEALVSEIEDNIVELTPMQKVRAMQKGLGA